MVDGCWRQAAEGKSAAPEECWGIDSGLMETACRRALASLWRRHVQGWPGGRVQSRIRKDGLAAGWRRTCNELGMPVPNHGLRFKGRGCGLDLYQQDHRGYDCDRRRRVHGNAERAMVGIAVQRMHVRHLH